MRTGPKPLSFHLGMASVASAGLAGGTSFSDTQRLAFFEGIKKYQKHFYQRTQAALETVWHCGEASLSRTGATQDLPPIILIPSMINRSEILDLLPDRSLLRFLAAQGFDATLFDWGHPVKDPQQQNIEDAVQKRLIPAIESLGRPTLLLGYCMGGLFGSAAAALRPDLVDRKSVV